MYKTQLKSLKAGKLVNTEHVNRVISNYKKERWAHNSKHIGKEDSLSVWYSVEELEEFLAEVKEHGGDGIKMYFGAYDTEHAPVPLYAERQTVVLVATKVRETENGQANKDLYVADEKGTTILAYNAGSLCPPLCTTSDDDFGGIGITMVDKGEDGIVIV
jgi:Uri superfamily endonuclease